VGSEKKQMIFKTGISPLEAHIASMFGDVAEDKTSGNPSGAGERISQIEATPLRKMRHPTGSRS
jgi:hypothetical protein